MMDQFYILTTKENRSQGELCCWWGPNRAGYVFDLDQAGVYDRDEAAKILASGTPGHNFAIRVDVARAWSSPVVSSERLGELIAPVRLTELRQRVAHAIDMIDSLDDGVGDEGGIIECSREDLDAVIEALRDKPT